ncbi:hypothetical protein GGS21DRAFT_487752 [Xylaria nigripes]|nr:hypothetical protein GGS21DRAFT_487752 [Xylaria nigripes]
MRPGFTDPMPAKGHQRQPRLRQSCDACFVAKVKCSKGQPACQRCLTCGHLCHYSPSSRLGKPRSMRQANHQRQKAAQANSSPDKFGEPMGVLTADQMAFPPYQQAHSGVPQPQLELDPNIQQPQMHPNLWGYQPLDAELNSMGGSPFLDVMSLFNNVTMRLENKQDAGMSTIPTYNYGTTWPQPANASTTFYQDSHVPNVSSDSQIPVDTSMTSHTSWEGFVMEAHARNPQNVHNNLAISEREASAAPEYGGNPIELPKDRRCSCFETTLSSLQLLGSISQPNEPSMNTRMAFYRQATTRCAALLSCKTCHEIFGLFAIMEVTSKMCRKILSFNDPYDPTKTLSALLPRMNISLKTFGDLGYHLGDGNPSLHNDTGTSSSTSQQFAFK